MPDAHSKTLVNDLAERNQKAQNDDLEKRVEIPSWRLITLVKGLLGLNFGSGVITSVAVDALLPGGSFLPRVLFIDIIPLIGGMIVAALVAIALLARVARRKRKSDGCCQLGFEEKNHPWCYTVNLLMVAICALIPSGSASAWTYLSVRGIVQTIQQALDEASPSERLDVLIGCAPELTALFMGALIVLLLTGLLFAIRPVRNAVNNAFEELYRPRDAGLMLSLACLMLALLLFLPVLLVSFSSLTMSSAAFFQIEGGWCVIVVLSALSVALLLFAGFRPSEVSFSCRQIDKLRSSLHVLFGRLRKKPRESASGNR